MFLFISHYNKNLKKAIYLQLHPQNLLTFKSKTMKLSDLKKALPDYQFELLHGIGTGGGLDGTERQILERFNYCFNRTNLIFDTSIFRVGYPNQIYSNVGLVVKDAELLRFSYEDGGRREVQDIEEVKKPINVDKIIEYLELYKKGDAPVYCELCITEVVWEAVFFNTNRKEMQSRRNPAELAANINSKEFCVIDSDWKLTHLG